MELNAEMKPGDLPSYVRRSFKNNKVKHVRLKPGMLLFTISNRATFSSNAQGGIPTFWSPYKKFLHDYGYDARIEMAKSSSMSAKEVLAEISAFNGKHPGGRYAVVAKLQIHAYGFYGPIRRQGKSAAQVAAASGGGNAGGAAAASNAPGSAKNLIGYQIYIPGLTGGGDIHRVRKHDLMQL